MELVESAKSVLIVYDDVNHLNEFLEKCKEKYPSVQCTGKTPEELLKDESPLSHYDLVLSGYIDTYGINHTDDLLFQILKLLKISSTLLLRQLIVGQDISPEKFISRVKISGFVKVLEPSEVTLKNDEVEEIKKKLNTQGDLKVIEIKCSKPDYEIGSSTPLSFAKNKLDKPAVWKIDAMDDNDESIDPDTLLDDDDLKKPDPSSLKVCGTTGKRKACKDCSCGLAEELEAEVTVNNPNPLPKSSCGSCYLGDAFRCASCPYLGMPAFKPGEKIQLADNQLQPDI